MVLRGFLKTKPENGYGMLSISPRGRAPSRQERVRAGADRHDDHVAVDVELGARDRLRPAAPGGVRLAEGHPLAAQARHPPRLVAEDLEGATWSSKRMPSCSAWWTSSPRAGSSSRPRR